MVDLKVLHTDKMFPKGFWFTLLWLFSLGIKLENDNYGKFLMISIGIHRLLFHFTIAMDNRNG
jgi:hypothetical protein